MIPNRFMKWSGTGESWVRDEVDEKEYRIRDFSSYCTDRYYIRISETRAVR